MKGDRTMNLLSALDRVQERLIENDARPETLQLVASIRKTALHPGAGGAQVRSLTDLVRRLMRTPISNENVGVYDDLAVLEEQLTEASAEFAAQRAAEEARPIPKTKKYYRQLREKEEKVKER
jgi:predicted RNA-binding Zn ribbon-like protein